MQDIYQTISTKYLPATNTRGSRIKAMTTSGISKTVGYKYELNTDQNHIEAAKALFNELDWKGEIAVGATPKGYTFTMISHTFKI